MTTTLEVVADAIEDALLANEAAVPSSEKIAAMVLDLLGIAHNKDEASTLVESFNGTYGLAYEPSTLSQVAGPRIRFVTSPDPRYDIRAHVRMDGRVEVHTTGMGYGMVIRPDDTNTATIATEDAR
jgi:hypothetical protein